MDVFLNRLDLGFRFASPGIITAVLTLIGVVPFGPEGWGVIAPFLPLAAIYYWAIQRPGVMPNSLVFAIGLLHDVLTGRLIGLSAVLLLLFRAGVVSQRQFLAGKPLFVYWLGFGLAALIFSGLEWFAQSVSALAVLPASPILFRPVVEAALFPMLCWLFIQIQRSLPER